MTLYFLVVTFGSGLAPQINQSTHTARRGRLAMIVYDFISECAVYTVPVLNTGLNETLENIDIYNEWVVGDRRNNIDLYKCLGNME